LLHARGVRWAIIALAGLVASSLASGVGSSRRHKARVMVEAHRLSRHFIWRMDAAAHAELS